MDPQDLVVEMKTETELEEDNVSLVNVQPDESPSIEELLSR